MNVDEPARTTPNNEPEQLAATVARIEALAAEYPVAIPTNLVEAALDQDTPAPVADSSLYDKINTMFGGPLPTPSDQPPATVLPCNHTHLRQPHDPHSWQPQPGMRHAQCPGWAHVPAAAEESADG